MIFGSVQYQGGKNVLAHIHDALSTEYHHSLTDMNKICQSQQQLPKKSRPQADKTTPFSWH